MPRLEAEIRGASREPLTPTVKRALLALVIFFHVGGGWALTQVEPAKLIVGDIAPMEVRMVPAEQAAEPEVENAEPPPPVEIEAARPGGDRRAAAARPAAAGIPDRQGRHPAAGGAAAAGHPAAREEAGPQARPAQAGAAASRRRRCRRRPSTTSRSRQRRLPRPRRASCRPRSSASWCRPTRSIPRARARRASRGTVMVRVFVDVAGRPAQVTLETSSGHPALDEAALSAVRAVAVPALFRRRSSQDGVGAGANQFCAAVGVGHG